MAALVVIQRKTHMLKVYNIKSVGGGGGGGRMCIKGLRWRSTFVEMAAASFAMAMVTGRHWPSKSHLALSSPPW